MILAFSHPCIIVSDLEKARRFYEEMFGFRLLSKEGWRDSPVVDRAVGTPNSACTGYMLAGHNCFLEMFEFQSPQQVGPEPGSLGIQEQGIRHLSFYVDDVNFEFQRFLSLGGKALGETEFGVVYCRDPFGNVIELCEIPNEEENPLKLPGISSLNTRA